MITPPEFQEVRLATEEIHWHQKHLDLPEEQIEAKTKPVASYVYGQMNSNNWRCFYQGQQ